MTESTDADDDRDEPLGVQEPTARLESVTGAKARERLRAGEQLVGVSISRLQLDGAFPRAVRLTGSSIGRVTLSGTFGGRVSFHRSTIRHLRLEPGAVFEDGLSMRDASVAELRCSDVTVAKVLDLTRLRTVGEVWFERLHVAGRLRMWDAELGSWVHFSTCTFDDLVDLRSIRAAEGVRLTDSRFEGDVWLRGAAVQYRLDFAGSTLQGHLDLSRAKLFDFAYFDDIRQGPRQTFSLTNIVAQRLQVGPSQLDGRLKSELEGDYARAAGEYGNLRANYQALHRYDDEDWAYRRYKRNRRRMHQPTWRHPLGLLSYVLDWLVLDIGIAYATSPGKTIRTAAVLIGGFALLYAVGSESLEALSISPGDGAGWIDRVGFGLLVSAALFTGGLSLDLMGSASGLLRAAMVGEALLGLLLWGLFIVSFSRKIIR